jgi:probable phosphoglycerate mutase
MTEIWIVRHGETPWNVERRVQGWEDIELNENGQQQAVALGQHLAKLKQQGKILDAIYSSDLKRAHQTASIVGQAIGMTPTPLVGVRERHFGILQGLIFSTMAEHQPQAAAAWKSRDPDAEIPGGETLGTFHRRVVQAIDEVAHKHNGKRVMVVSHGGALDIMWRQATGVALDAPRDAPLLNASINRIRVSPQGWELVDWGQVDHLAKPSGHDATA